MGTESRDAVDGGLDPSDDEVDEREDDLDRAENIARDLDKLAVSRDAKSAASLFKNEWIAFFFRFRIFLLRFTSTQNINIIVVCILQDTVSIRMSRGQRTYILD